MLLVQEGQNKIVVGPFESVEAVNAHIELMKLFQSDATVIETYERGTKKVGKVKRRTAERNEQFVRNSYYRDQL